VLRSDSFAHASTQAPFCVYDSSVYFIRSLATDHEVLIFGDVEPDSISLNPRNRQVWIDAAPKIARGLLKGIFVECSYPDSQPEETLFGHLKPWFLMEELKVLAGEVAAFRKKEETTGEKKETEKGKKRKRYSSQGSYSNGDESGWRRSSRTSHTTSTGAEGIMSSPLIPTTASSHLSNSTMEPDLLSPSSITDETPLNAPQQQSSSTRALEGVTIVIIHVKDRLDDREAAGDVILRELREYEDDTGLGCEFVIARKGESVFL